MSRRVRRLLFVGVLTLLASLAVVGGAAAGAASAPAPIPEAQLAPVEVPAVEDSEPSPGAPAVVQPAPRRHAVVGVIVGIRPGRIAVAVKSQDKPVIVGIRPATQIRVNRHQATFEDLQTGDAVLVVGRPGPRGNVIARTVSALQTVRSS